MPPAVDREAGGTGDVHRLVETGLAIDPADAEQEIGGEDQHRAAPAGGLDRYFLGAQAARFRNT
jgi:hypothetical protein